jgi:hypothetical protein
MPDSIHLSINGKTVTVRCGTTAASALLSAGGFRRSISGQRRVAMCGMGTCFECRATVDGVPHQRTCVRLCREGMDIRADA